ncbi:MAG: hypothetical protein ACJ8CB_09145, partial [Ktedonobacteraceae bacterium]
MRFKPNLPVLIALLLLLAACSPLGGKPVATTTPTPTVQPTHQVTPTGTLADNCLGELSHNANCYTPHALRVAYSLEALTEQGFTGKGQTVIDIVSYG